MSCVMDIWLHFTIKIIFVRENEISYNWNVYKIKYQLAWLK